MLRGLNVDAHFDKMAQWQKKPNNMKNVEKECSRVRTIGQNDRNDGPQAHKIISGLKESKQVEETPKNEVVSSWES